MPDQVADHLYLKRTLELITSLEFEIFWTNSGELGRSGHAPSRRHNESDRLGDDSNLPGIKGV